MKKEYIIKTIELLTETEILQQRRDITIAGRNTQQQTISHIANSMASTLDDYVTRNNLSDLSKTAYDFLEKNIVNMFCGKNPNKKTEDCAPVNNLQYLCKQQADSAP